MLWCLRRSRKHWKQGVSEGQLCGWRSEGAVSGGLGRTRLIQNRTQTYVIYTVTTHQRGQKASCAQWILPLQRHMHAFLRHKSKVLSSKVGRKLT